jgi:hypothetical protein
MQAVDVLVGIDAREQGELVEAGRLLDDEARAGRVGVELVDDRLGLRLRGAGGQWRIEAMPISAQSRCLAPTYQREPGSSPTSTVPRPGTIPRSLSAATRAVSSALISLRVVSPSSVCAVTGVILSLAQVRSARTSPGRDQCAKWRVPVRYIVTPAA